MKFTFFHSFQYVVANICCSDSVGFITRFSSNQKPRNNRARVMEEINIISFRLTFWKIKFQIDSIDIT